MSILDFLRDLLAVPANLRRIADASEQMAHATEALKKKYAPPAPPDIRYRAPQ